MDPTTFGPWGMLGWLRLILMAAMVHRQLEDAISKDRQPRAGIGDLRFVIVESSGTLGFAA